MSDGISDQFSRGGYAVIRGLLEPQDIAFYIGRLKALAGGEARWTLPDGVGRHPDFWPIIFNARLLAGVREVFGPDVRYLPHNDLHLGFSSFSWHRDSVNRDLGKGPDWDESKEPYQIVRVGIYLQSFEESGFKLGFVRGSHRLESAAKASLRTGALANVVSGLSGVDLVGEGAEWIATNPGDCIMFDPRLLHTGSKFSGEKYSIFVAYGVENSHFRDHWQYYLKLRADLGYATIAPDLADQLAAANLLADAPPAGMTVDGAWIPSSAYTYVARRFK
jgi:hypothetical protein